MTSYEPAPLFVRRERRFYTAKINSHGVWSYQIDGTAGPKFELTVFYASPSGPAASLGLFDHVQDAERAAYKHWRKLP